MAAIAGIALPGHQQKVVQMLQKLSHRGKDRTKMLEKRGSPCSQCGLRG